MDINKIQQKLFELQDPEYKAFHSRLVPTVDSDTIIGVRTPDMRALAKEISKDKDAAEDFMACLPHKYIEENNIHGVLIGLLYKKDIEKTIDALDIFLPYVNNWATCDLISPKVFKSEPDRTHLAIEKWLKSSETYVVRFGVDMLLEFFLDDKFSPEDLVLLSKIRTDEYYINMAVAWYYSYAIIKQYDEAIGMFKDRVLDKWIHNKSLQKARESYRIPPERKEYLNTLKIK